MGWPDERCPDGGKICYPEEWKAKLALLKYADAKQYYWHKPCNSFHVTTSSHGRDATTTRQSYARGINSPHKI
jgi:hypothetical protein